MKEKLCRYGKWILPVLFVVLGCGLSGSNATSFLGLICWCLAGLVSGCYLLALLKKKYLDAARFLYALVATVLIVGMTLVTVTGVVVADAARGDADTECGYIIVLGAKVNGTAPSRTLRERIDAAYAYLVAHPQSIAVVSGGQGSDEGISEAQCMFNELTARGIDPQRVWMEDQATSTWGNLNLSLNLIEEKTGTRPTKIALVSSEFHLYRAILFAGECGVDAVGVPGKTGNFLHFLNYFLREIAGVWHYLILGGQYS